MKTKTPKKIKLKKGFKRDGTMTKKREGSEVSKRIKKLDSLFSKYIRKRDSDYRGYISCITCGKQYKRDDTDQVNNCHFIERGYWLYRFDEINCNAGCVGCNKYNQERHKRVYTTIMVRRHGLEFVEQMDFSKKQINMKPKLRRLQEKYTYYEEKLKNINT